MNKVSILGTITRDIEIKYTPAGTEIVSFGIAVNEKWKNKEGQIQEKANFFECSAFSATARNINQYFRKGSRILIDGSLDFQSWTSQTGEKRSRVGIKVDRFDFIDRKSDNQGTQQGAPAGGQPAYQAQNNAPAQARPTPAAQPQAAPEIPEIDINMDDIPF